MRSLSRVLAILIVAAAPPAAAATIGVRDLAVPAPQRHATLHALVWYPATPGGTPAQIGGNGVFRATPALRDAPLRDAPLRAGRFPLVLIAHGGLRAAPNMASWLAASLAARGYIAVVVNPPHPPRGPARQSIVSELWLRPADLSATLTAIAATPALAARIDPQQTAGVGFFLGGTAMLSLAGARLDSAAYAASCDGPATGPDCAWFAHSGVNLHRADPALLARSNRDPRLKLAIAVNPELAAALSRDSLAAVATPVRLIALGPDPSAARLAAAIPHASAASLPGAGPFSAFATCKPKGRAILQGSGGETTLCDEAPGQSRPALHARLATMIAALLHQAVASP